MRHINFPVIIAATLAISGCGVHKPYAQNSFNPAANIPHSTTPKTTGKVSDSLAFRAGSMALATASRPIPGTLPHGVGVGITAAALLLGGGKTKPLVMADHANYLTINMPISEAENEEAAQIKMGLLVENAIIKTLQQVYQTRIEEYDDSYMFGKILRPRWIRVNGPYCENWSCQVNGPIPTANALQWEGKIEKRKSNGIEIYDYPPRYKQSIGFVKITKEYDKNTLLAGPWHVVEAVEVPGFDYEKFFQSLSENLPDWVTYHIAITNEAKYPYILKNGEKEEMRPNNL